MLLRCRVISFVWIDSVDRIAMKLRLLYHGRCFDGVCSAVVFTRFYSERLHKEAQIRYRGLHHRPGELFDEEMFDGDENAIVDFKYSPSERLTWWFDHHQSAFLSPADEEHYRRTKNERKVWDPTRRSCTELIADYALARHSFHDPMLDPLVAWAHKIDGALYDSAAEAVELRAPALQLMLVIESEEDERFIEGIIRALCVYPLDEVAASDDVQRRFRRALEAQQQSLGLVQSKAIYKDGVVFFDLLDEGVETFNKFAPYYLFPETTYSVALTRSPGRTKISVGSNPWSPRPRRHNIATICERYGGGGHPVVGAVSFRPDETERARAVAREIVAELSHADGAEK